MATDQFDEITSAADLRYECRSLLAQIQMHQTQINELRKKVAEQERLIKELKG